MLNRRPEPPGAGGTALVLIDIDAVKAINDNHGHPVGGDVLVHRATTLRTRVRAEDAVLSRLGGDELAVLMPGAGGTPPCSAPRNCWTPSCPRR